MVERDHVLSILLVEDNQDHAELTMKALGNGNARHRVFWVKDGEEAVDFLTQKNRWAEPGAAPRPSLVLLDVNLPKVSGHDVLRRIKSDERLRAIPVVMLTTSDCDADISGSYCAGANSFVTKPVGFADYVDCIKAVKMYWIQTNRLPG
jgi:CheY-like chemotaxis protein